MALNKSKRQDTRGRQKEREGEEGEGKERYSRAGR